jgi:hypothetical protein
MTDTITPAAAVEAPLKKRGCRPAFRAYARHWTGKATTVSIPRGELATWLKLAGDETTLRSLILDCSRLLIDTRTPTTPRPEGSWSQVILDTLMTYAIVAQNGAGEPPNAAPSEPMRLDFEVGVPDSE